MSISIKKISSNKELKAFIKFPFRLYQGNQYYVPPLIDFELSTLKKDKNPAFDHCDAQYWLAYKDGEIVGRIAGIIHNEELKEKSLVRFGWIDFTDDLEVSEKLINEVVRWGESKGASKIHGPLGFTDLDFEGALVSGYDQMATQATIYNYPYYINHYEKLGFEKAVDWVEMRGRLPNEVPKKISRTASIVSSRFNIKVKKLKKTKEFMRYAPGIFEVLNESYSQLYGYYPISQKQIDYYVKQYFGIIRKEFVCIVVNDEDKVIGTAISLPSLSKALQKAKGSLFPFGFIHILKAFRSNEQLDAFLIGVHPEYQKLGAISLIFNELFHNYVDNGVSYGSTGPMLEDNLSVLSLWRDYKLFADDTEIRRRCYIKSFVKTT